MAGEWRVYRDGGMRALAEGRWADGVYDLAHAIGWLPERFTLIRRELRRELASAFRRCAENLSDRTDPSDPDNKVKAPLIVQREREMDGFRERRSGAASRPRLVKGKATDEMLAAFHEIVPKGNPPLGVPEDDVKKVRLVCEYECDDCGEMHEAETTFEVSPHLAGLLAEVERGLTEETRFPFDSWSVV